MTTKRFVILAVLAAAVLALASGPVAAQAPQYRYVYLEVQPGTSSCTIKVSDDPTTIWRSRGPAFVKWIVLDPNDNHEWVIAHKNDGVNHLPGVIPPITCNGAKTTRTPNPPTATGDWDYSVSVYSCSNGRPSPAPICKLDPKVIILP